MGVTKTIRLIYTQSSRGTGKENSPFRGCDEVWTLDGKLVLRVDPCPEACRGEDPIYVDTDALRSALRDA